MYDFIFRIVTTNLRASIKIKYSHWLCTTYSIIYYQFNFVYQSAKANQPDGGKKAGGTSNFFPSLFLDRPCRVSRVTPKYYEVERLSCARKGCVFSNLLSLKFVFGDSPYCCTCLVPRAQSGGNLPAFQNYGCASEICAFWELDWQVSRSLSVVLDVRIWS